MRRALDFLKGARPIRAFLPIFCADISETIWRWSARYPELYPIGRAWIQDAKRYAQSMEA